MILGIGTWLTGLKDVQRSMNNISSLSTTVSSVTNSFADTTVVKQYANALSGLNKEQTLLALSSKNLTTQQEKAILVEMGLINTENAIQSELLQTALSQQGVNKETANAILIKLGLMDVNTKELLTQEACTEADLRAILAQKGIGEAQAEGIISALGLGGANSGLTISFDLLAKSIWKAITAMAKWLLTNPVGWAILATTAIVGLVKVYDDFKKEQNELIKNAKELKEEYRSFAKEISDSISSLKSQSDEFEELSKGVSTYGENISLSSEEYDRYKSIVSEILGYSPELIDGYNAEGTAIANKNSLIERSIELMKEEQRQKLKEMTTDKKTGTAYKGAKAEWQKAQGYEGAYTRNEIARIFEDNEKSSGFWVEDEIIEALGLQKEWDKYSYHNNNSNLYEFVLDNTEAVTAAIKDNKQALLKLTDIKGKKVFKSSQVEDLVEKSNTWEKQYAEWQQELENVKHGMDDHFSLYAQRADGYNDLTDAQKAFVSEYIKATGDIINADGQILSEDKIIKKAESFEKFVNKLAINPEFEDVREKINELFALDSSTIPAGEYEKQVNDILGELQTTFELTDDEVKDFKIALGFEFIEDGNSTRIEELINMVQGKLDDEFHDKVGELSLDDLQIAANLTIDPEDTKNAIESELKSLEQGGSVNLTLRPQVSTSDLNDKGWDAGEGTATVFSSTISNTDFDDLNPKSLSETVAINFTPIVADPKTGEYLGVLTEEQLYSYAHDVIAGVRTDDLNLQIGANFEGENAIQQAEDAAIKIHELHDRYFVYGDVLLSWEEFIKLLNEAKEIPETVTVSNLFDINFSSQKGSIDDYQSKLQSLGETYSKVLEGNYSGSELIDMLQSLQEAGADLSTIDSLEELDEEILQINDDNIETLIETLNIEPNSALADYLRNIADEAVKVKSAFEGVTNALSNIQNGFTTVTDALDEYNTNGYLTIDTLNKILTLEPEYLSCLRDENGQLQVNKDAYTKLVKVQLEKAKTTVIDEAMTKLNEIAHSNFSAAIDTTSESENKFIDKIKLGVRELGTYTSRIVEAATSKLNLANANIIASGTENGDSAKDIGNSLAEVKEVYDEAVKVNKEAANEAWKDMETKLAFIGSVETNIAGSLNGAGDKDSKEDTKETYDWIETKIERLTEAYDEWKDKAGQAFRSVKARVEAYNEAIEDSNELIELNKNAKEIYMNKANSVGLDEYYAKQVRDGSLNIETVDDETVREKIEEYTKWYDKARECGKAVKDLKLEQKELTRENIELVTSKYEKLFSRLESANDRISKRIDIKEALGFSASESDYNKMNDNIQKQIDYNDEMIIQLKKLQGTVKKGSIAWYEYQERIDSTTASTQDLTLSMIENAKAKAALAGEKAERRVEKLDSKDELTDAKIDNATSVKRKNALIDNKIGRIDDRQKVYDDAYNDSSNDLTSSRRSLLKKKNKKTNTKNKEKNKSNKAYNSVLNKVKTRIKSGKKIGQSLLNEVLKVDEGLYELCVQYNADFDAKVSNKDIADLYRETSKQDKADLAMEKFNNISTKYDNNNIEREHRKNSINAEMDLLTEQGKTVSTKYYQQLINEEKALQTSRLNQAKEMQAELDEAIKNGHIKVGSPEYYDAIKAINDINEAYEQGKITLEEYANAQRQIKWDALDKALESIKRINSETDYYIELMSNEKLVDEDTGNFTEYGIATLASRKVNMENYFSQAKEFQKKYNKLMQDIAEGKESLDDEKVVERLRYLEDGMRDATLAAKNEEQAIVDLVKQGYDAQLDSLNELIDKYKELKNSEKEAYEYQKQISEKTANITKLQKQLSALSSNDTEEAKAKIQKLKVELEDAETDLRETEYDKYLSDTENMLSDLYNDYEEFIDEKLNNVTELLKAIFASNLGDKDAVLATLEGLDLDKNVSELLKGIILGDTTTNKNATEETKKEDDKAKGTNTDAKSNTPSNSNTSKSSNIIDKTTESIISSNSVLGKIVSSSVKKIAEDYINKKANTTKKKKTEFKAVNQAIYKLTGGKVLSADEQKELAKKVGVTFNGYGKDDNLYQRLKLLGIKGFKVGSKNIPEDQLALLAEEGTELQFDTSQGVLRTIGKGDMIFTNEMSQRLWEMAKGNMFIPNLSNMDVKLPDVVTKNDTSNVNINLGGIVMNGVNDPEEFTRQLNSHLANNSTTIKLIQNQSVGALNKGYNSLSGRKF